jgi:hypothetical protein
VASEAPCTVTVVRPRAQAPVGADVAQDRDLPTIF